MCINCLIYQTAVINHFFHRYHYCFIATLLTSASFYHSIVSYQWKFARCRKGRKIGKWLFSKKDGDAKKGVDVERGDKVFQRLRTSLYIKIIILTLNRVWVFSYFKAVSMALLMWTFSDTISSKQTKHKYFTLVRAWSVILATNLTTVHCRRRGQLRIEKRWKRFVCSIAGILTARSWASKGCDQDTHTGTYILIAFPVLFLFYHLF